MSSLNYKHLIIYVIFFPYDTRHSGYSEDFQHNTECEGNSNCRGNQVHKILMGQDKKDVEESKKIMILKPIS